ncbi:MAG: flagellar biosynthesis protein FliQ [Erysipelotrichales bacterium]|nr:flagellar biosynthesis protein FliQ [Erysipelotrichales bacterium]
MSTDIINEVFRQALLTILQIAGPLLLASIVVGLVIAIFQAATQIHEQTLTFAPKLLVIGAILMIGSSWMASVLVDFINTIFKYMLY